MQSKRLMAFDCPSGFVIPDVVNSTDNWYANETFSPCAFQCRSNSILYTEKENNSFQLTEQRSLSCALLF